MGRNDDRRGGGDEEIRQLSCTFSSSFCSREGARGGRDQFSWDNVKNDRNRQHYVGHSVHANVGRWQKNRDVFWYTKENSMNLKESEALRRKEIEAVKAKEEEYMLMAMFVFRTLFCNSYLDVGELNQANLLCSMFHKKI